MGLDVGLMPLDDSPFSQGKCGLKILQYHAAGLPVVCSPVGANRDMMAERETGLFARTPEEWEERISRLLSDPELARAWRISSCRRSPDRRRRQSGAARRLRGPRSAGRG